ncbi:MAG: orotate phosphoribosyltransferase [Nitrososphaeraceae archaeon]
MNFKSDFDVYDELFNYVKKTAFRQSKEKIKLSSGLESNYYFDLRKITMSWYGSRLIGNVYGEKISLFSKISDNKFDIGGMETGAIPIISTLVNKFELNGFYVRKKPKEHGTKQAVEGVISCKNVILVDDVVTTGSSINKCIHLLEKVIGLTVLMVAPILDRSDELGIDSSTLWSSDHKIEYSPIFKSTQYINM